MDDRDRIIADMNAELERLRRRIAELESGVAPGIYDEGYRLLFESNPHPLWVYDLETLVFLAVNDAAIRKYGYSREEFLNMTIADIRPREDVPHLLENIAQVTEGLDEAGVWRHRRKDGSIIDVEIVSHTLIFEGRKAELVLANDITERKQAEAKIRNVTRLYAILSQINQAIVRTRDRDELFWTICRVAIEFGRFRMAWVGLVEEATGIVRPAAHAGREEGYLGILSIDISNEATSSGPTGSALREGVLTICDDVATDARMLPWREEALKRGYRSSAAIPFRLKERVIGSLNLYAAEPGFFTEDERKLLTEIGIDITFSLDTMEGEKERKRTEEALRESEERLQFMMSNSPAVIYTSKPSGDFGATFISPNVVHQMGYEPHAFISDPGFWAAHIHPDDAPRIFAGMDALFSEGSHAHEYRFRSKDGTWRWMHDEMKLIRNAAGEPVEILGSWVDVSDRKRMEEALRSSEKRYRELFETAQEGIAITDLQGNYLECNRAYLEMLGFDSLDDLRSRSYEELTPPEYHERERRIIREQTLARGYCDEYEKEYVRRTGERVPVSLRAWLRLDGDSRPMGMWVIVRDNSERKRVQEALRKSEERLRLALSAAKQGLYDLNVQTGETVVTPEYALMLGYAPEEFIETNAKWIERLHPDDRAPVAEIYRAYVSNALPEYRVEFRQKTKSGEWKWVLSIGKIVEYDASGKPLRMLGTHTDITDRKLAEQERLELERRLLHAQKLESLGVLAGGIAHDFNNLLMAVLGNLDLALRKLSPVSPARLNIEQSAQAARRAADLTRQMLAYSGKGSFVVKAMDLSELVEENAHLFRSSVARTIELNVRLDRSLPAIDANAGQVQQVIMNLITNASEAIGEEAGMITLATGVQKCDSECLKRSRVDNVPDAGRFVFLEVSDNGCGMDAETQQRLFDPFFTTKAMGRGLGMSAILGIVRGHGGAIFVDSAAAKGTTIRILFPATQGALALNDCPAGAAAQENADSVVGGTVLVVDDEEIVRAVCKDMVEAFGLKVLTAVDGRDAVEVFTKHADDISLVILDLSMPNMDGMTAFQELVRIRPGVKVILCSGFDEQDSLQRLSGQGLAGFIQKPYSMKNLLEALENAGIAGG